MFTLILVMYVQYGNTSIHIAPTAAGRYATMEQCDSAGQTMLVKPAPNSPVKPGTVNDLRVGYVCIRAQ
jgi:hypothetical protein